MTMISSTIQTRDPDELLQIIDEQGQEIAWLREQNRLLTHYRFASKSEQVSPDQVPLFPLETDHYTRCLEHPDNQPIQVKPHARKKTKRLNLSKSLPRERVLLDLNDHEKICPCCDTPLSKITDEITEKVEYVPASLMAKEFARAKYACKACS